MPQNPLIKFRTVVTDYYTPNNQGGRRKFFEENYSQQHILRLVNSVNGVSQEYAQQFAEFPEVPGVFRVNLIEKAIAKSHRPDGLFSNAECEVIGVGKMGELYVAATSFSLELLAAEIANNDTQVGKANISTIKSISALKSRDKWSSEITENSLDEELLKLRIFNYRNAEDNLQVSEALGQIFRQLGVVYEPCSYNTDLLVYKFASNQAAQLNRISKFLAVQSIERFPDYRSVRAQRIITGDLTIADIPLPEDGQNYPVVGVFDSGVDPRNTRLAPWIVGRVNYIPEDDYTHNFDHGTFVSGLIVASRDLNHQDARFPSCRSKVLDVGGLHTEGISELDLITRLEDAIDSNPEVKVWNLSLNSDTTRDEHKFSELAAFLDRLQREKDINIVLSAGNFTTAPMRGWPNDVTNDSDLITTPGESALSITVGSLAQIHNAGSRVRNESPSPFSRKGPGTGFISKPEVVHYGGNCSPYGNYQQTGILSAVENDRKAENVGTSFSTPIVANILANIRSRLISWDSRIMGKALLIHSAILGSPKPKAEEIKYRGFGKPLDIDEILGTEDFRASMIYEFELVEGMEYVKDITIPNCLRTEDGKTKGRFSLTVVYDPPLDANSGAEYCRCNIEVSVGGVSRTEHGNISVKSVVPPAPTNMNSMFERSLVENGFKWSPVKVHQKEFPRGIDVEQWALRASLTARKKFTVTTPIKAVAILTIEDPNKEAPVYRDLIQAISRANVEFEQLPIANRTRLR